MRWARGLEGERVWALEDCRHVSGALERFLIGRGERVLRIPTHLTAAARRKSARQRGKSDPIDAIGVARAALHEGLESFPAAHLDGPELDLRLLVDHRERLVRQRVELNSTLQWHLHDLWPELELPGGALFYGKWGTRIGGGWPGPSRRCASGSPATSCGASANSRKRSRRLEAEIAGLVAADRSAAAHRARVRTLDGSQARRRDRRRPPLRHPGQARPRRRRRADPRQLRQHPAPPPRPRRQPPDQRRPSPRRSSPAPAATPLPRTTSPAAAPKARAPAKRSAASNATSPAASGNSSNRPTQSQEHRHHHQILDIEAT